MYDIDKKYRIPKKEISCPSCGKVYGYRNTKVCEKCEECNNCCRCDKPLLKLANKFITENLGYNKFER